MCTCVCDVYVLVCVMYVYMCVWCMCTCVCDECVCVCVMYVYMCVCVMYVFKGLQLWVSSRITGTAAFNLFGHSVNIILLRLPYTAPKTAQWTVLHVLHTDIHCKITRRREDLCLSYFRFTINSVEIQSSTLLCFSVWTFLQAMFWKWGVKCLENEAKITNCKTILN